MSLVNLKQRDKSVGKHNSFDKAVYKWFMNARERNVPVGRHITRQKALDFAKKLEITDFKSCSISNCLWRGKIMHN